MTHDRGPSGRRSTRCFTRWFPHPVQRVWRAITDPAHLERWLGPARIELRPGGRFHLGPEREPWLVATIAAVAAPRLLALRCDGPGGGSIHFELREQGGGCLMTVIERDGAKRAGPGVGSIEGEPTVPEPAGAPRHLAWRRLAAPGARVTGTPAGDLPQAAGRCRRPRAAGRTGHRLVLPSLLAR